MKSIWRTIGKVVFRIFLVIFTTVFLLVGGVVGVIYTLNYGPSESARSLFVSSVLETSAIGFLATWFLPTEEVETILASNTIAELDMVSNPDLVMIADEQEEVAETVTEKEIELVPVSGLTYSGRMLIVKDPSRVYVGTCTNFGQPTKRGERLVTIVENENALAGINGGGFDDPNGMGTGTVPLGFVFSKGEFRYGSENTVDLIIGFDSDDKLIVGYMTGRQAKERGIRDALTFGPALIIDGVPAEIYGQSSGVNPRTAIGQRADGAVLLLVVDGRQASSLGASYSDLIDIMLEFGAVNAANLDGGSSSVMVYDGEVISKPSVLTGDRTLPACFLVERRPSDEE